MKLSFFGATRMVTGSNYLLETGGVKILIDCGLFQGLQGVEGKNSEPFSYNPKEIDAVILTHAHLDHVGRLPILAKNGFRGKIFATSPTIDLTKLTLSDALDVQKEMLFSEKDVETTFSLFEPVQYHEDVVLKENKAKGNTSFKFLDAGHILGSAIVEIFSEKKKIVFSGDLGNAPVPLIRQTEFPSSADFVVVESTYGDTIHKEFLKRKDALEDTIEETIKNNGTLMIPAFAIERTQELLYELNELVENHRIPRVPVFVDSPLAINSINVYKNHENYYNKEASYLLRTGDKIFDFKGLTFTKTVEESKRINGIPSPKIIIAGSGMSNGGRIMHHEKRYLPDAKSCFLIICYQVEGTLGRQIQDGVKEVEIMGDRIPIRAKVKTIEGYSAHADRNMLFRWLYSIKSSAQIKEEHSLKKVFVTHGEVNPANSLAQIVRDDLGVETELPEYGSSFEL